MAHARRLLRPLLGLRPLLCPRPRVRTYIDDVYKTLGYAAPFTKEESESVVGHINAASDFDALIDIGLSKKMSVMLVKHREKHFGRKDTIECVEQLLDINDITEKQLVRSVRQILKRTGPEDKQKPAEALNRARAPGANLRKLIYPAIMDQVWADCKTHVGIKFSLNMLSCAKLSNSKELLDWKSVSVFDWDVSKHQRAFEHPKMYEAALAAVGAVPEADLYFVEETSRITGGNDRNIDLKVPTLELQATLVALLNSRRPLTNQSSQIGVRDHVYDMFNGRKSSLSPIFPDMFVNIPTKLMEDVFVASKRKETKEQLALALTLASSAMEILNANCK